eukprot:5522133-Pyramimonas_sp.AAC.1
MNNLPLHPNGRSGRWRPRVLQSGSATMAMASTRGAPALGLWCQSMAPAPETFSPSPMDIAPPSKVTSYGHWV